MVLRRLENSRPGSQANFNQPLEVNGFGANLASEILAKWLEIKSFNHILIDLPNRTLTS